MIECSFRFTGMTTLVLDPGEFRDCSDEAEVAQAIQDMLDAESRDAESFQAMDIDAAAEDIWLALHSPVI